jgi:hypothetical protein
MSQMPYGPVPTPTPPWAQPNPVVPQFPTWLKATIAGLSALSLLALGLATAAWFRAAPGEAAEKVYSQQEQATAREAVCSAKDAVTAALSAATKQPEAKEPGNTLLVAVNIRLAEYAGADYLAQQIAAHPAAPRSVTDPAGGLVDALRRLAMGQLGDAPRDTLQPITGEIGSLTDSVTKACEGHT